MSPAQTLRTLNELISVTRDGERGFRRCAARARDPRLRAHLFVRAHGCARAELELQAWVERMGGEPVRHGTRIGAVHRGWVGLRATLARDDDAAILTECERGEGHALSIYRNALDDPLPDDIRQLVQRQFIGVMDNHEEIRRLRRCVLRGASALPSAHEGEVTP